MTWRCITWMIVTLQKAGTPRVNLWAWANDIAEGMLCYFALPVIPFLLLFELYRFIEANGAARAVAAEERRQMQPPLSRQERAQRAQAVYEEDLRLAAFHDDDLVRQAAIAKAKKKYRDALARLMSEE